MFGRTRARVGRTLGRIAWLRSRARTGRRLPTTAKLGARESKRSCGQRPCAGRRAQKRRGQFVPSSPLSPLSSCFCACRRCCLCGFFRTLNGVRRFGVSSSTSQPRSSAAVVGGGKVTPGLVECRPNLTDDQIEPKSRQIRPLSHELLSSSLQTASNSFHICPNSCRPLPNSFQLPFVCCRGNFGGGRTRRVFHRSDIGEAVLRRAFFCVRGFPRHTRLCWFFVGRVLAAPPALEPCRGLRHASSLGSQNAHRRGREEWALQPAPDLAHGASAGR